MPPNTTCRYHFQGRASEIVWLSFVKYYAASADAAANIDVASDCNTKLLIWDGDRAFENFVSARKVLMPWLDLCRSVLDSTRGCLNRENARLQNISLMGQFCKDDTPRLCDHSLLRNGSRHARPCSLAESYVSTGRDLTIEHVLRQGSALYPISFVLRYEFVHEPVSCNRVFASASTSSTSSTSSSSSLPSSLSSPVTIGKFASPKSVFFYGRGGAQNVSCVYRFETEPDHRIELSLTTASFGDKGCSSYVDPLVNRWSCDRRIADSGNLGTARLVVAEYPWQGVQLVGPTRKGESGAEAIQFPLFILRFATASVRTSPRKSL